MVEGRGEGGSSKKERSTQVMCQNSAEGNKRRHKSMKNKANKATSKAMREMAEEVLTDLQNCPNGMFHQ